MRIPKGHGHGFVPKDLLDILQAGAAHDHVAGESVTQIMKGEIHQAGTLYGRDEGRLHTAYPIRHRRRHFPFSNREWPGQAVFALGKGEDIT
ncbi:MAG: hypothetical protein WAW37_05895 [Syntrophobacteraceae bacterium]